MCKVTYGMLVVFKGEKILCKDFAVGSLLFIGNIYKGGYDRNGRIRMQSGPK
jgi:hypothetical protein